nr:hypothetical protein CFP56_40575 [Quercus suber]
MLDLTVQIRVRRHRFVSFSVTHSLSLSLRSDLHRRDRRFHRSKSKSIPRRFTPISEIQRFSSIETKIRHRNHRSVK